MHTMVMMITVMAMREWEASSRMALLAIESEEKARIGGGA
jgi:hypothetical protein